jgi:hypothetical protein
MTPLLSLKQFTLALVTSKSANIGTASLYHLIEKKQRSYKVFNIIVVSPWRYIKVIVFPDVNGLLTLSTL